MPLNIALTAFDVCTVITVIGVLACRLAIVPSGEEDALQRGLLRLLGVGVLLLTLSSFGIFLSRTLELAGGWQNLFANMGLALRLTHFGRIWIWRIPALVLLWVAWAWSLRARRQRWADWLMLIAVLAIALTRSETGHPADRGDFTIGVWADWVHLVAAAAWIGSLFGISLVIFPRLLRAGAPSGERGAIIFQRLSTLSGIALACVAASGIYTAIGQLGSFHALWTSRYGITLDVKVFIVILMIAFGAHNRYIKLPRLLRAAGRPQRISPIRTLFERFVKYPAAASETTAILRACARAVLAESLLGVAAIAAASVLLHGMPPADMPESMPGIPAQTMGHHAPAPAQQKITRLTIPSAGSALAMAERRCAKLEAFIYKKGT